MWADSSRQKTEWSIVFLHGFSASAIEGDPVIFDVAKKYKMNTYLARLAGHGIEDIESFKDLTPKALVESAKEALAIGKLLGEKILVIGSSTGCTLAAYLVAENPEYADAMMFYSPNIDLHDKKSAIATMPWGLQIMRKVFGGNYRSIKFRGEGAEQYWTTKYRLEGLVAIKTLINETMKDESFEKIKCPFFLGYWYKNDKVCDKIISIPKALHFYNTISTPQNLKEKKAFDRVDAHVLTSKFQTRNINDVRNATYKFIDKVLLNSK